ncbi:MAG TPA: methylated-DNA--[protein]-cysteine S-methyltransferase [Polyangiaceae bacterium]|nr:methylated-DNA--[protein]-cysteine S-methyltransferase [Polyangiaceae bacterium]
MKTDRPLLIDEFETPIGKLAVLADEAGRLHAVGFFDGHARMESVLGRGAHRRAKDPAGLTSALRAYFEGELAAIDGLQVVMGGTDFQRSVWRGLLTIPCGQTRSYGDIARQIGRPNAVRAVGLANGSNPIGIVVPCHRVIGSNGTLTGYGGGIERKRWLLAHEGVALAEARSA